MKALLFDFAGVFMSSPFTAVDDVAATMQVDALLLRAIIFGDYRQDNDHPWHQLERGEISLDETREAILCLSREHQLEVDIFDVFAGFAELEKHSNDLLVGQLLQWKAMGYKLAMVTNNIKEFDRWRQMFPFDVDDVFDVIADSCHLGTRKPDPAIFEYTLSELGVEPEQALFVDDYPTNVSAAEKLGISSYCLTAMDVKSVEQFIDWVNSH